MQFPRLLAALLGAASLCSHAATYQVTDISTNDSSWESNDLNRNGAVSGVLRGDNFTSRAYIFENGQMRLLKAVGDYNRGDTINDRGDVAGQCQKNERHRSCIWKANGSVEVIVNTLGGSKGFLNVKDMNNARQVVGEAQNASKQLRAFIYENGAVRELASFGGFSSRATGINKLGHVSGYGSLPDGTFHAFLHDGTQMTDLGTLADHAFAEALNDNDVAVGRADVNDGSRHAVMFKGGQIIDLGTLGGDSEAWGINNQEDVVGASKPQGQPTIAFIYRGGRMIDLNTELDQVTGAGWHLDAAIQINDKGQIVAMGKRAGEWEGHVLLLTPMP